MDQGEPIVHAIVSSVYGPGDDGRIAELLENHLAGHALAYLDRDAGCTFTHVQDVASRLQRALEDGQNGKSYLFSGEPHSFEEFFGTLSEQTGIPAPCFELPDWTVDGVKPLAQACASLLNESASEVEGMIGMGRDGPRFFLGTKSPGGTGLNVPVPLPGGSGTRSLRFENANARKVVPYCKLLRLPCWVLQFSTWPWEPRLRLHRICTLPFCAAAPAPLTQAGPSYRERKPSGWCSRAFRG